MRKLSMSTCLALALVAGCATTNARGRSSNATPMNSNEITERQLDKYPSDDAYEIIERLHPDWLMNNARASFGGMNPSNDVQVYIGRGETWLGGVEVLHNYTASQLSLIYHLNKVYAGNPNGAIILLTR